MLPLVPVIVSVYDFFLVVEVVVTVNVELPEPATDAGLNVAFAPVGSPLMVNVSVPLNPAPAVVVTV